MDQGGATSELIPQEKRGLSFKDILQYLFPQKTPVQNPNAGMQWNYKGDKWNPIDAIAGRKFKPSKPVRMYGLDKKMGLQSGPIKTPEQLNYDSLMKYNPYIAEQYLGGKLKDWEAQRLVNNGNYGR